MKAKDLKNSILQMAVQGKLVPQDPSEEPASVLLERIRAERVKLVEEKKIKAPKGGESVIYRRSDGSHYEKRIDAKGHILSDECIDDEIPFEIPESWEWARLEGLYNFVDYRGKTPKKTTRGVRLITASNIRQGYIDYQREEYISFEEYNSRKARGVTKKGDILFTTEAPMGYCAINEVDECSCGQRVITLQNYYDGALFNSTFCFFIQSPSFQGQISEQATGTTARGIKAARLKNLIIPVPPLSEQHRIAEKISTLLPLIEEYGKLEDAREMLDTELPERLRKSILQQAVQGKLVPQNPTDEPASVLLERIRAERVKLIEEKKIKFPKNGESIIYRRSDGSHYEKRVDTKGRVLSDECIDDEIPFEIPESWEWCRGSIVYQLLNGVKLQNARYINMDALYLRGKRSGTITDSGNYVSDYAHIILVDGENSGEVFVVPHEGYMGSTFKELWISEEVEPRYINLFLKLYQAMLRKNKRGAAIPHLDKNLFSNLLVPLPPLSEQKRIADAKEELLQIIC